MTNFANTLKEEMARHARKELRGETDKLKKASTRYRSDIADLKRKVALLEQQLARLEKRLGGESRGQAGSAVAADEPSSRVRFSAAGLKKHRIRLGLTAAAMGALLRVSTQTIYNWEAGATRPSKAQVANIAAIRKLGKRAVQARLGSAAAEVSG